MRRICVVSYGLWSSQRARQLYRHALRNRGVTPMRQVWRGFQKLLLPDYGEQKRCT